MAKNVPELDKASLLAVGLIIAVGGLIYELILGTASSYLFGDSVTSFSLSIGTTLFGMGIGSLAAIKLAKNSLNNFIVNELVLSLLGGNAVFILFAAFAFTKLYWLVFIVLSLSIGFAIGLEIPLVVSLVKARGSKQHTNFLSKLLALDYVGALIGSLLFPFVLLPYLGLTRTAYAVGLLNTLIAFFLVFRSRSFKRLSHATVALAFASVTMLGGGLLFATQIETALNSKAFNDPVVYFQFTPYQKIAITQYNDDRRLYLNDNLQFSSIDESRYHETLVHAAAMHTASVKSVLVYGGGDGLVAREILKYNEAVENITIVDIDEAITNLATNNTLLTDVNNNAFNDPRVTIINQDAFTYTNNNDEKFDLIIADLVDPANEKVSKLYSKQFYQLVASRLHPNGIFTTQATSTFFTPNAHWNIVNSIEAAGFKTKQYSQNIPSFGEWGFVVASKQELKEHRTLPDGLVFASQETLSSSQLLTKELLQKKHNKTSTLLSPTIYRMYQEDMKAWRY